MSYVQLSKRVIKKPRKKHICYACQRPIEGAHLYFVGIYESEFVYEHVHFKCDLVVTAMCSACEYNDDCMSSVEECYNERYSNV